MSTLKPCPCGQVPEKLGIVQGDGYRHAYVGGTCCWNWHIGFCTDYKPLDSPECMALAEAAWNAAPRSKTIPATLAELLFEESK